MGLVDVVSNCFGNFLFVFDYVECNLQLKQGRVVSSVGDTFEALLISAVIFLFEN